MLRYFLISFLIFSATSKATTQHNYYGQDFYNDVDEFSNKKTLKKELNKILKNAHIHSEGSADIIVNKCPNNKNCYTHKLYTYKEARKFLFGTLYLDEDAHGTYIKGVYCNYKYREKDFPKNAGIGKGKLPSAKVLNTEHTWPQSKFNPNESQSLQKADLHILFPASPRANSLRSNLDFQQLSQVSQNICNDSGKGYINYAEGNYFEPPEEHKGNVARALFYFSVRYQLPIVDHVENTLRLWHINDPIDQDETNRHQQIFEFQKVRNPFIDHPWLVNYINDF
ncbi:MAG: endonuclease [Bdellovibrionales bacterium]|nr:endonuclease [Bdellovibrionales bacterium]